jgi:hypothetical protein
VLWSHHHRSLQSELVSGRDGYTMLRMIIAGASMPSGLVYASTLQVASGDSQITIGFAAALGAT